jgi:hypothetical protein
MSITAYFRHKTNHGWRYEALGIGRRPEDGLEGDLLAPLKKNRFKQQYELLDFFWST